MSKKPKKIRIDELLVAHDLANDLEQAKRYVMAGLVYVNEERVDTIGSKVKETAAITIKGKKHRYVSRGGLKLEKALQVFSLSLNQKMILDIGSSTGGFTDCALLNGAIHSYALDVGSNQLAWKLRNDARVTVLEKTNFRHAKPALFTEGQPQVATIDVSFISLALIFPNLATILELKGEVIALVKPQFEAVREEVGAKGIVSDPAVHLAVLQKTVQLANEEGFQLRKASFSPITGGEGNIEFLFHLQLTGEKTVQQLESDLRTVVEEAHEQLRTP